VSQNNFHQLVMRIGLLSPRLRSQMAKCTSVRAIGRLNHRGRWRLASALVAASFAAGSPVFAQYAPPGQPYQPSYTPAYQPVYAPQVPAQAANQSDEQLLAIGRLLEQEGRYAQAQRIYTELERRRMAGGQQQQPATMPPNAAYQPQGGMAPQTAAYPNSWQAPPSQYANQAPVMDLTPQNNAAYGQRPEMVASQVSAAAPLPPPAPPSEAYVVDKEVTPQPKTTDGSGTQGWRSAIAPLQAAFRAWNSDRPTPSLEPSSSGRTRAATNTTESASLPDLPIAPVAPLNSFGNQFPAAPPAVVISEPPRFLSPTPSSGERRWPISSGQELAPPSEMRLKPMPQKNLESLEAERETSQKQTDAIRIIPGQRPPLQLKPESGGNLVDPRDQPANLSAVEPPKAGLESKPAPSNLPMQQEAFRDPGRAVVENPRNFDLAAWVATPEFREIHTADVLAGLDLLARSEPRYRAQGAIRIAAAGEAARTALPVLRRVLASEADRAVRLRIAETVLKLQPNDRRATECLAEILAGRNETELRQAAASALGGAATGRNSLALASLTDALDDASPSVRAASAASLGLFGRAAADSVSRLESAAINDIPSVQRAAVTALASIRGGQSGRPTDQSSAAAHENPFNLDPLNSKRPAPFAGAAPSGRALLSDRARSQQAGPSDGLDDESASLPPKLFPPNRPANAHVLTPAPAATADDAVPVSATAAEAPSRPFTTSPAAAFPPLQWDATQSQAPPAPDATSAAPAAAGTFVLQSEAGAAKASSKP
jgi:hypothetical protein